MHAKMGNTFSEASEYGERSPLRLPTEDIAVASRRGAARLARLAVVAGQCCQQRQ